MKTIQITSEQVELIAKAVRYMISDLQYERHQALAHHCDRGSYDKEIDEYKELKQFIEDVRSA